MPQPVTFNQSLLDSHLVVDVRTPLEFEEDHIPGAVNVPLLSNEERVEIGTLYKQTGPREARIRGLELTAPRFPELVAEIGGLAAGRPILVYCWRGGLRSKTVSAILDLTGYDAVQLQGGYKTYRNQVLACFENFQPPARLVVIHGMTGIGKTPFILGLDRNDFSFIDLEGLACHRGSAFGELGLTQDLSQKWFESLLWDALRKLPGDKPLIVEGESKRIGKLSLPGNMYEVMQESTKVWCHASLETRVERLIREYGRPEFKEGMAVALLRIKKRLGGDKYAEIEGHLERWELQPFMAELVKNYYDKVYYKNRDWVEDCNLSLEDYQAAEQELKGFLHMKPRAVSDPATPAPFSPAREGKPA
ncbi:geranyl-diphosphate--tRNA (5-carboxymethylaminomethyl-2-thiouridine34-2-S)-geranyltransferase and selenophosphate--tRNA (5-carboxymethylaminomethyl-2-thiouridine34-C2)-selenotransferase [Geotalea daltonii FRC-32]|uniref:Geranyl-diphosphate--tRNA (5-carboxymethylaminomethyl-2-thiouridine34-2-S)-geranyltransferase and selenophosphate--tRNA (5-carboxymethylaminomethyl-2-thiouridine34-C2)-selenotransferase n=1 Tax=Geotalea daltonii (strain DSM 22248 / JCM 15807 / FRC-32) TaxID=316067 RepID=B9M7B7_GEODF|nr:tRNA 2-selenouridine(34) synthase MnmH [Geotalea daltonii]ACM20205.1 geranyl-diphosphate--tRNA (5-carboxymethylaminomethyl-2-thiouridine34-2-S)-geranyltransferase and selenophosphate--tRNA (5-carboxymethylaminomethyl-2-thiouridine34-C2)-selenotransferase [Geotalea daltonii FRC-32]